MSSRDEIRAELAPRLKGKSYRSSTAAIDVQQPQRAIPFFHDVAPPHQGRTSQRVAQSFALWGLVVVVATSWVYGATVFPLPIAWAIRVGGCAAVLVFLISLIGMDTIIFLAEWWLKKDINKDGVVGVPVPEIEYVDRPLPVSVPRNATTTPSSGTAPPPNDKLRLEPSGKVVTWEWLWNFFITAFETGDWSRAAWDKRGVGKAEWTAVQDFVLHRKEWRHIWKTDHRPTLDAWLAGLGYPVPDRPVPAQAVPSENDTN